MAAIDELRGEGINVGLLRIRLWRPFPFEEIRDVLLKFKTVIVLDRSISFGGTIGPVCSELKAAVYAEKDRPKVIGFTGGLGGRDISALAFKAMVINAIQNSDRLQSNEVNIIEVRE
jgi:pyruvate ferredoxin oxidoreductase alpha subunit